SRNRALLRPRAVEWRSQNRGGPAHPPRDRVKRQAGKNPSQRPIAQRAKGETRRCSGRPGLAFAASNGAGKDRARLTSCFRIFPSDTVFHGGKIVAPAIPSVR